MIRVKMKNKPGLHAYFFVSAALAIVLVGSASIGLWTASNRMAEIATTMDNVAEGLNLAQEIQMALSSYRRQALLQTIKSSKDRDITRGQLEENLIGYIRDFDKYTDTKDEARLVQQVRESSSSFVMGTKQGMAKGLQGPALYIKVTPAYEAVMEKVQELISVNEEQSRRLHREGVASAAKYKRWAIACVALILLIAGSTLIMFQRFIYHPLMQLKQMISEYSVRRKIERVPHSELTEIQDIATAFHDLSERLRKQGEQQVTFVAAVAHDLKNPLSAIQMSLDLIAHRNFANPQESTEIVELMGRQVNQLRRLVDDLLDTARIEVGKVDLKPQRCDWRQVIKDSVMLFRAVSSNHEIRFAEPTNEIPVFCDPQRIGQVINNLLSNAIKYSPNGGLIQVSVEIRGLDARLTVRDNGTGIDPEDLPRIFEPFHRSPKTKDKIPGLGLGLATVQRIVEAHRGRIEVESLRSRGTTFTISIPLAETSALATNRSYLLDTTTSASPESQL